MQSSASDHLKRIFTDHEKLKFQLESQKNELELRKIDLEKREAHNESERKKLAEEIEEVLCFFLFYAACPVVYYCFRLIDYCG